MHRLIRIWAALVAAIVFSVVAIGAAAAQDISTKVIVPEAPGGALVGGCYRAVGFIYKVYRFEFCLERHSTYTVTGGGHYCQGRLDWRVRSGRIDVDLKRTSCGGGVAWSADTMSCRPNGLFAGALPRVIVPGLPNLPFLGGLRCDYRPARGSGEKPTSFLARRMHL